VRVSVLGTGMVGQVLSGKIAELGHDVMVGTRDVQALLARTEGGSAENQPFSEWMAEHPAVKVGTFAEAAAHGEVAFNATAGHAALEALEAAGPQNLAGKILIDVTNPLDHSGGFPPTLFVCNTDSLGEQIQRAHPRARVVKTLNTVNAYVMVDPKGLGDGDHHVFVSSDDQAARAEVARILRAWFGWEHVIDLGDISTARGPEMYVALWIRLFGATGDPMLNVKVVGGRG
jgi:8-hydroxy-5-deazaflavin:NADPH oxidoreductase